MKFTEVSNKVDAFILNTYGIEVHQLKDRSLLNPEVGLEPRDLIYLFFELQKEFGIRFKEEDILERKFHMLNNIKQAVYEKLCDKSDSNVCQK